MAVRVSKTDFEEKVLKEKLPVLVDFYSDSCVACKKLAPVLGNAEDDYEDKIKVYKVNTNFDVELAEQYEVQANPTLILFKDGQAKDRKTGALKQAEDAIYINSDNMTPQQEANEVIKIIKNKMKGL